MKVFSKMEWLVFGIKIGVNPETMMLSLAGWVKNCEGKTKEECKEMGYLTSDKWFVQKEKTHD